ncbi:hypothetical protein C8F01DRAFT_1116791 [Mycena amicta]|nr:hypothetical protein C8F01DRAFT_1116791 [Mycena amicta]
MFLSAAIRAAPRKPTFIAARRTLFGLGPKAQPPDAATDEQFDKTARQAHQLFDDQPEAVRAIVAFAKIMEASGVQVSAGKMPGPMQLLQLAKNPKFHEAYREVESELGKAGIDIRSKEFIALAKQLYSSYNK